VGDTCGHVCRPTSTNRGGAICGLLCRRLVLPNESTIGLGDVPDHRRSCVVIKEAGGRGLGLLLPVPGGIYRLLGSHLVLYRPVPFVGGARVFRCSPAICICTAQAGTECRGRKVDGGPVVCTSIGGPRSPCAAPWIDAPLFGRRPRHCVAVVEVGDVTDGVIMATASSLQMV